MSLIDDDIESNTSGNPHLGDIIASRRNVILGGMGAALAAFALPAIGSAAAAPAAGSAQGRDRRGLIGFTPVEIPASPRSVDTVTVAQGYGWRVLAPWGTPLQPGGPEFDPTPTNSASKQNLQVGMHHDGMHYFPTRGRGRRAERGLLVMNHEYIDQVLLFGGWDGVSVTADQLALALAAHGVSVLDISSTNGLDWELPTSQLTRRVTGDTPVVFSGPVAADHPLLATAAEPRGTLNNCAHGYTPWGTYLACEENFNGYFGATGAFTPTPLQARYGLSANGFGYKWHTAPGSRFDLSTTPNEANRFGWVVEIDPFDPQSAPVKRTALGRFKHEGAYVHVARGGTVVAYMGDDENGDYLYKFVSSGNWRSLRARGMSPLDHGTLYVAAFNDDGTGSWLPLVHGEGPLTVEAGWADQADVLIRTRQAADALGATRLDRPEWTTVDPRTGACYVTLTNGSGGRGATSGSRGGAAGNPYGQIVRWLEAGNDHRATSFTWEVFLFAGDPQNTTIPNTNVADTARFGSPDGLWSDPDGRLWIQTDMSSSRLYTGANARLGSNQMLCADPDSREVRRFLIGPPGCEVTGVITTPDQRTMFVNIQHPGEDQPSTFPGGAGTVPRSCTIVITKDDGGKIGT